MGLAVARTEIEGLFETLAEKSPVGVYIVQDGKFCYANPAFQSCIGYRENELVGMDSLEFVFPEDREMVKENAIKMLKGEVTSAYQFRVIHKTGSIRWVMESVSSIQYGGRRATLGNYMDITERKEAEEAPKDSEERYRELADSITDVFFAMDENLRYTYWNKASEILTGTRSEDAIGKTISEVFPDTPGTRRAEKVYRDVLRTRQSQTFANDFDINGTHYIFEISAYPSRDGISVFVRDITERKKAEEATRQAAQEWRETFDSISDAISIHGKDYRIRRANAAFADIFDMEPDRAIGKHCYELHKGTKPISGCPHQQTLASKKPAVAEFYESHLGKHLLECTSPILDMRGEVVGTVHVTRDITKQKELNEQLMMADRLASVGELAAGAAHELNNPLTSILGFSRLLMEKRVPDDVREDLEIICSEAQRATEVIKQLLEVAREHQPVKQPNQMNRIVEDVLKLRAHEHRMHNIKVERRLATALPEIMVDYSQMRQVLLNVVINAEQSMSEARNGGTLTISTRRRNSSVVISVADDGPGISQEHLGKIFNPFFTTKKPGKGTGLGLSICYRIVTEHGGQIYARSQSEKGATFLVELPINCA
jgi:PAS domain S-box-containing protein